MSQKDFKKGRLALMALFCLISAIIFISATGHQAFASHVWPTQWYSLGTDPDEKGCSDHRNVIETFYNADASYLYLRMQTVTPAGWPSTGAAGDARYKWFFDTNNNGTLSGGNILNFEYMLSIEDPPGNSNDGIGQIRLYDGSLESIGGPISGTGNNAPSGPQSGGNTDFGYKIEGVYVDMYIKLSAIGNPTQLQVFWATDQENPNLDQAPNCDRPDAGIFIKLFSSVKVVKTLVGQTPGTDWAFTGTLGSFNLPAVGGEQTFSRLTEGLITITETTKPGYTASVSCSNGASGANSVTFALARGQDVTCTFTNSAQPGSITVVKQLVGEAPATAWNFTGDLGNFNLPAIGGQNTFNKNAGTYTITEIPKAGYDVAVRCVSGTEEVATGVESATVTLAPGQSIICTFTNSAQPGSIKVVKSVAGAAPATAWDFTGTTPIGSFTLAAGGGEQTFSSLASGTYTITETTKTGYTASVICSNGTSGSNIASFKLNPGEAVTCTFTNTAQPGSIKVVKSVVGAAPATAWAFTGTTPIGSFTLAAGGGEQTFSDLASGDYTITETTKPGFNVAVSCPDKASGVGSVSFKLNPGESVTCTFVNTNVTADLAIVKESLIVGDNINYTLTVTNNGPSNATDVIVTDTLPTGVNVVSKDSRCGNPVAGELTCNIGTLNVGANTQISIVVTRTNPSVLGPYINTACVSTSSYDPIEANNCSEVQNTFLAPKGSIKITKIVSGLAPLDAWQFTGSFSFSLPAAGGNTTRSDLIAGDYTITETTKPGYSVTINCGAGVINSNTVTVTLAAGQNAECTFTNTYISPDVRIIKSGQITGQNITYTLTVKNHGPSDAANVVVTDTLPANTNFVSAGGTGWTCTHSGGTVTCTRTSLAAGATAPVITIVVTPTTSGSFLNRACVVAANDTTPDCSEFRNDFQEVAEVPTLSEWSMIILSVILFFTAIITIRRRMKISI